MSNISVYYQDNDECSNICTNALIVYRCEETDKIPFEMQSNTTFSASSIELVDPPKLNAHLYTIGKNYRIKKFFFVIFEMLYVFQFF